MDSFADGSNVVRLKGVEERLDESERRYRELFEFAPISLWEEDWSGVKKLIDRVQAEGVTDLRRHFEDHPEFLAQVAAATRYLDVNDVTLQIYGASDKRALIEGVEARNHGAPSETYSERILALLEGKTLIESEYTSRKHDGTEFDARIKISIPQMHRADWSRVLVAIEDVTEKNRTEKALRESEAQLKAIFDHAPFELSVKDIAGCYLVLNRHWEKLHKVTNAEAKGKTAFDFYPQETAESFMAHDREVIESGETVTREATVPRADCVHTYVSTKFPCRNAKGQVVGVCTIPVDITDRKRAEEALYDSEAQLRAIFDNAPFEITVKDLAGRYLAVNRHSEKVFKATNAEIKGKMTFDFHPRESAESIMAHDREVIESGETVTRENTVPELDGVHTYVSTKFPFRNAKGQIVGVCTIPIDITERKRHEAAVAESEKKYRRLVELAPYLICIHEHGRIKYINPAGARIFGAESSSLLMGRTMEDLIHPDSLDLVSRYERRAREKRVPQPSIEVKAVRLDDELIDIEISFIPFDDPTSDAVQVIGRDITEQKLAKGILDEPPDYRKDIGERFTRSGAKNLFDRELLQLILFPVHRRRNVKALAERLLDRFGGIAEVISADPRRLAEVPGTGEATIVALKATQEAALRLIRNEIIGRSIVGSWKQVLDYLSAAMAYNTIEQFRVLFLDRRNIVISDEVLQDGTLDHAPIYPRQIIKRALEVDASALILVHNHPSGDPKPSHDDIEMTKRVIAAGKPLGIEIHDHIIIGKGSPASFRSMGLI